MKNPSLSIILFANSDSPKLFDTIGQVGAVIENSIRKIEWIILCRENLKLPPRLPGSPEYTSFVYKKDEFTAGLKHCFEKASSELVVTMEGDGSHAPFYLQWMLESIKNHDVVIASRYVPKGGQAVTAYREFLSKKLNRILGFFCSLPIKDLTGSFRLYRKDVLDQLDLKSRHFEIHTELTIRAIGLGYRVTEIPFYYRPAGRSLFSSQLLPYGFTFLRACRRLRTYRNSIDFCDYDERAYNSRIPPQRIWQRRRFQHVYSMYTPKGTTLDIGCGTGKMILSCPEIVGMDINLNVLRYLSQESRKLVQSIGEKLPFGANVFETIYCCEVAEHLPQDCTLFSEISRVLCQGGHVVMTTPDYGTPIWPAIEKLYSLAVPHAYGHTHISKYNRKSLPKKMAEFGLSLAKETRMFGSILIMLFRKD